MLVAGRPQTPDAGGPSNSRDQRSAVATLPCSSLHGSAPEGSSVQFG